MKKITAIPQARMYWRHENYFMSRSMIMQQEKKLRRVARFPKVLSAVIFPEKICFLECYALCLMISMKSWWMRFRRKWTSLRNWCTWIGNCFAWLRIRYPSNGRQRCAPLSWPQLVIVPEWIRSGFIFSCRTKNHSGRIGMGRDLQWYYTEKILESIYPLWARVYW